MPSFKQISLITDLSPHPLQITFPTSADVYGIVTHLPVEGSTTHRPLIPTIPVVTR